MSQSSAAHVEPNSEVHSEHDPEGYGEANRAHFNEVAHKVDGNPVIQELVARVTKIVKENFTFDPESTILLDYACGTGLLAAQLAPLTKKTVGVDISQGMIDFFNEKAKKLNLAPEKMQGICQELKVDGEELNGKRFDLILCAMAYHHFPDINAVTRILASYMKPGGSLFVIDGYKAHEEVFSGFIEANPQYKAIIAHKGGIEESAIEDAFSQAGLQERSCTPIGRFSWQGMESELFLMKGTKV